MRIVLVEDHDSVAKGICYRMEDLGHSVDVISDGLAADQHLRMGGGDLVILDISLPGLDGLSILRAMRQRGDGRPVLLLTARAETHDRVRGLDAGADDYLVKPFEMDELEARIRALARRQPNPLRRLITAGDVTLDLDAREVSGAGIPLALPRREVSVMEILMSAQGRTVSKGDLIDHLYGTGADIEESAVEVHISRLRKRLKPYGLEIRVARGLGYALVVQGKSA